MEVVEKLFDLINVKSRKFSRVIKVFFLKLAF